MYTFSPSLQELDERAARFLKRLNALNPDWDTAFIINKTNMYYFTGTRQDGVLVFKRNGDRKLFARRSFNRAKDESPLDAIFPMRSYGDVAAEIGADAGHLLIENDTIPVSLFKRITSKIKYDGILPVEKAVSDVRAVKSPWELTIIEEVASRQNEIMRKVIPQLLTVGKSETEFYGDLKHEMLRRGHMGFVRFNAFQEELMGCQFGFGENSLDPCAFDGPGGMRGMYPAAPFAGDRNRFLKKGDLVFVDLSFAMGGYHTDISQAYSVGMHQNDEVENYHAQCKGILEKAASLLKPGVTPAQIYENATPFEDNIFMSHFMGMENPVRFLGHSFGLTVDEKPVIAKGFDEPITENMVFAIEPKRGVEGHGYVGVEEDFLVTKDGCHCISGGAQDIIIV